MGKSAWHTHLANIRRDYPHLNSRDIMAKASSTYRQGIMQSSTDAMNIVAFLKTEILGDMFDKYCATGKIVEQANKLKAQIDRSKEDLDSIKSILADNMDFAFFSSQRAGCFLLGLLSENDHELIQKFLEAYHKDGGTNFSKGLDFTDDEELPVDN